MSKAPIHVAIAVAPATLHPHPNPIHRSPCRYFSAWAILYSLYVTTLNDVDQAFPDIDAAIPSYIIAALTSTFIIFSSCAFVPLHTVPSTLASTDSLPFCFSVCACVCAVTFTQILWQWFPPGRYWQTEVTFAFLSMTAKLTLGAILIANLLGRDAQEGSAGNNNNN